MNLWNYYLEVSIPTLTFLTLGSLFLLFSQKKSAATRQFIAASTLMATLMVGLVPTIPLRFRPSLPQIVRPYITFRPTPFESVGIHVSPVSNLSTPSQFRLDLPSVIALVMAIMSLLLALRLLGSLHLASRLRKRSAKASVRLRSLTEKDVRVVEGLSSPVALGGFKPLILLPAEAEQWPEDQLRAILIHEEAHLDNGDPNWQILAELVCLMYWFNPLVWLVRASMRVAAERAADDAVIRAGVLPSSYANNLISFASRVGKTRQSMAWTTFARKNGVKGRIKAILSPQIHRNPMKKATKIASVIGLSIAAYATSAYVSHGDQNPQSHYQDVRLGRTTTARSSNGYVAQLSDHRNVEIVQISRQLPNGTIEAWKPDGTPLAPKDVIHHKYYKLDVLDTHTRYLVFRFPEAKGDTDVPVAGCGSGPSFAGQPNEMIFAGGGTIGHKDGFYTVVSYIGLPKEDSEKFSVGIGISDASWKDVEAIDSRNPHLKDVVIKEVSGPEKNDKGFAKWWQDHQNHATELSFVLPIQSIFQNSSRILPILKSGKAHKESLELGNFGGYIQKPPANRIEGFNFRYYFAYRPSEIKEFRYQTRSTYNCEVLDLAANPKGIRP